MVQFGAIRSRQKVVQLLAGNPQTEKPVEIQEGSSFSSFPTRTRGSSSFAIRLFSALSGFNGVVAPLWLRANAPMVVADVCSTMKYPKRCQYKHAKQKKYHVRNWAEIQRRAAPPRRFDGLV